MTTDPEPIERAFVLGLDGVPWSLVRRWAAAGELPNFEALLEEGVAAPLESTTPPTTPAAWPSIATGVWPDEHGLYGFHRLQSDYTQAMNTSANLRRTPLWERLSPAVVGNVPMTYPASDLDGAMVAGMISPSINDRFAAPPELLADLRDRIPDYEIGLNWYEYADEEERFLEDLETLLAARRALMERLMETEEWRLFFFVYTAPDRLQHLIWDEDVILEHYRRLDEILGDVLAYVDERRSNLFVVSDHGFGPISTFVNLNTILAEAGYLSPKGPGGTRSSLSRLGVTKSSVLEAVKRVGVDEKRLVRSLPDRLVEGIAEQVPGEHALYDVDFDETVAFAHSQSYVYVNDAERFDRGVVDPDDVDSVTADLRDLLSSVTDPETGERALSVATGDEVFPNDPDGPDLVVTGREGYEEKTGLAEEAFEPAGTKAAGHRSEGTFFAYGPDVAAGDELERLTVVDVAPTLLHSVGEPVPADLDGAVRTDVLATDAEPTVRDDAASTPDEATADGAVDEDFGDVEDRLRGLGYMD